MLIAALAAPTPVQRDDLPTGTPSPEHPMVGRTNYPAEAMRRNETGIVSVLLDIDAAGRLVSCKVTETSGSKSLDRDTCDLFLRQVKYTPARDAAGMPIASRQRMSIAWGLGDKQPRALIELPLTVAAIPAGYARPVAAKVLFDSSGRAATCGIEKSSGSPAADRAACDYAVRKLTMPPPETGSDESAVAVRFISATFETASRPKG